MTTRQLTRRMACSIVVWGIVASSCSFRSDSDQEAAESKAEQLIESLRGTSLAPRLTVAVAVSLYGTDAPSVCGAFDGGLNSNEYLLLLGNPSNRRSKTVTEHSVEFTRRVVRTYCPDQQTEFDDVVEPLNPVGHNR